MIPAEPQQTRGADRARWRVLMWVGVTVFLALATLAVVATIVGIDKNYRFRANWKAGALTQLTGLTLTNPEVARDFQSLKSEEALEVKRWTSGSVLLMKNGEYLFYKFRHALYKLNLNSDTDYDTFYTYIKNDYIPINGTYLSNIKQYLSNKIGRAHV